MRRVGCGLWLGAVLLAAPAGAGSLDLSNHAPRWVAVAFEVSPPDRPDRLQAEFTRRLPARLEPGTEPGEIQIRIAGHLMERFVLTGHAPQPGSFGDFTWTFDASTGHVRAAHLTGAVQRTVGWGFASWTAVAKIEVHMSTDAPVAFRTTELAGQPVYSVCPPPARAECRAVAPRALDTQTGYVNAVGSIRVNSGPLRVESFSPLGEAIFTEIDDPSDPFWSTAQDAAVHAGTGAHLPLD